MLYFEFLSKLDWLCHLSLWIHTWESSLFGTQHIKEQAKVRWISHISLSFKYVSICRLNVSVLISSKESSSKTKWHFSLIGVIGIKIPQILSTFNCIVVKSTVLLPGTHLNSFLLSSFLDSTSTLMLWKLGFNSQGSPRERISQISFRMLLFSLFHHFCLHLCRYTAVFDLPQQYEEIVEATVVTFIDVSRYRYTVSLHLLFDPY
jgi:hypothetical protein